MKTNCDVIRDLIPLYVDRTASEESIRLVDEHCTECKNCSKIIEMCKADIEFNSNNKEKMEKVWKNLKKKKRKRMVKNIVILALIIISLPFAVSGCEYMLDGLFDFGMHNCIEESFGEEIYAESKKGYSISDKKEIEPMMKKIEEALNFIGKDREAKEKFGELSTYCVSSEVYSSATVEVEVEFVTAKLYNDTGYLWIKYSRDGYLEDGRFDFGSSDVLSRITLVKFYDEWEAVNTMEAI